MAELPAELADDRMVAVLRAATLRSTREIVTGLVFSGIRCVELTWTIENVLSHLAEAASVRLPLVMGAWTPTEVAAAADPSPAAVKLFPAETDGPAHLRALRGPFGELAFMPSGGVSPATAGEWLGAGALAVSAGSTVAPPEALRTGDSATIDRNARQLVKAINDAVPS